MIRKGYCGNEGLGLAWDQIKVRQIALYVTTVTDNRKFWITIRPLFANKIKVKNKITLEEES